MPTIKGDRFSGKGGVVKERPSSGALRLGAIDSRRLVERIRVGFPFSSLARLQKASGLPWDQIAGLVGIPNRTLTRRRSQGKLQPDESDRVWRASRIFDLAVDLFEGDRTMARRWLQSPQAGLGGEIPLNFASTDVGSREVEKLIGRLEHGVIA